VFKSFAYDISRGIRVVFTGCFLFWHLLAIVLTYILVVSGFDWWFFSVTRGDAVLFLGASAGLLGLFIPLIIPLLFYGFGVVRRTARYNLLAVHSFQAVVISFFIIAGYKALTGRIQPDFFDYGAVNDISRAFQFGFLRHGIFWGWPSSHAGVAFALSTFLFLWFRNKRWIGVFALFYASYIAFGASVSFHWFSDVLAGVIVGSLVGYVVYAHLRT